MSGSGHTINLANTSDLVLQIMTKPKMFVLDLDNVQLGQPSMNPPGLVLEAGGTSTLQAAMCYACKVEVPPHFKVPSGGDFSSPGMAAC